MRDAVLKFRHITRWFHLCVTWLLDRFFPIHLWFSSFKDGDASGDDLSVDIFVPQLQNIDYHSQEQVAYKCSMHSRNYFFL